MKALKMKTFNVTVEGYQVHMETDRVNSQALDQLILSLLFNHYRKGQKDKLKNMVETIITYYAACEELKSIKGRINYKDISAHCDNMKVEADRLNDVLQEAAKSRGCS